MEARLQEVTADFIRSLDQEAGGPTSGFRATLEALLQEVAADLVRSLTSETSAPANPTPGTLQPDTNDSATGAPAAVLVPTPLPVPTITPLPDATPIPGPTLIDFIYTDCAYGLVGWWPGEGNAEDALGPSHGSLYGNVTFEPGMIDQAFRFNTPSDYVFMPPSEEINTRGPYPERTIALWYKGEEVETKQTLWEEGNVRRGLGIYVESGSVKIRGWNNVLALGGRIQPWGPKSIRGPIVPGVFYHIILILDQPSGTLSAYLDGELIGQELEIGMLSAHGNARVGTVSGLIDDILVFNRALNDTEIAAIFEARSSRLSTPSSLSGSAPTPVTLTKEEVEHRVRYGISLDGRDLRGQNLCNAQLNRGHFFETDLSGASLTDSQLVGAYLYRSDLSNANLTDAQLTTADLTDANPAGANLTGANLDRANLSFANLTEANLTGVSLVGADLNFANLTGANLTGANLEDADLSDADLSGANLAGANLTGAIME
ncbi:MAG: hypothetical protein BZY80_01205 [SAR202 cluster bacterium Io17-Chloro-G2]|nr:MAG: hypothetical protein BZY80_01205 [SAR202 cluster bacterium Io17-Chloro-G2]